MSEMSKSARNAMRAKISRLVKSDPKAKVDASGYSPPDALDAEVKTGARPVSRRQFKKGGKVVAMQGEMTKHNAGRKPRKSGGKALTANSYVNRDVREANEEREGKKHIGAFKKGGMAKHDDEAQDKKLIRAELKKHEKGCCCAKCGGGAAQKRGGKADGGSEFIVGKKGKEKSKLAESAMKMASKKGVDPYNTTESQGKAYKALWKMRGKPEYAAGGGIDDDDSIKKDPIADAASRGFHYSDDKGGIQSTPLSRKIDESLNEQRDAAKSKQMNEAYARAQGRKGGGKVKKSDVADGKFQGTRPTGGRLARKHGGKAMKGATIIKIDIAPKEHEHGGMGISPAGGPAGMPIPMPPKPTAVPPPAAANPPMPMPPPSGPMPPMGRKSGGRVGHRSYKTVHDMDAGSGGGLGRLEKVKIYGKKK